jgi:hypothetical protein
MRRDSEDYVGTCQACFGEFKVDTRKQVVLHGYERPGNGAIKGKCPGAGHAPFEYSHAVTDAVIGAYRNAARDSEAFRARLVAGEVVELLRLYTEYDRMQRRQVKQSETISPASPHWAHQVEITIANLEGEVRWFTKVANYLQDKVDGWQQGGIVGLDSPVTGRERGMRAPYDPNEEAKQQRLADQRAERAARPGKLKMVICWPRALHDDLSADEKAAARAWARGVFPEGKLAVAEDYDTQLPNRYRHSGGFFHVLVVRMDWSYRDQVAALIEGTETTEIEPKRISYLLDLAGGRPW